MGKSHNPNVVEAKRIVEAVRAEQTEKPAAPLGIVAPEETAAVPAPPQATPELAKIEPTPGRQGAQIIICPYCTKTEGKPVQCKSGKSSGMFTHYYCPTPRCPYSQKVPRMAMIRRSQLEQLQQEEFSAR